MISTKKNIFGKQYCSTDGNLDGKIQAGSLREYWAWSSTNKPS